ncbi:monovalent cation/H+ antiporter subunit D [Methylophaga sp.]|uniref:monovalent cation/H+ antiporter subunit D n=1 Tax=Methylophaga sp. TaxID=2024840 RepID=UPI003F69B86C
MISQLPILPVLLPLIAGFSVLFARVSGLKLQRIFSLIFTLGLLILTLFTLNIASDGNHQVYLLGNWSAPFGIVLVMDQLAALMLLLTAILALFALIYAISQRLDEKGQHFHVLYQLQLFGINGAFLTGDLFNLFVFFEVLLLASYGLLLHGGGRFRTKGGLHYVVINLVGSALFLFAVGTLYGILGTLNIADLASKMATVGPEDQGIVSAAALLLLVVFGIKAAIFPLYLWLPGAYAHTSAAVAALFAIMTKVGLYAIIRVHGTLFGNEAGILSGLHIDIVLVLGMITLILAALGVMAARALKEQVAYLILASVATLLIGIGINTEQALSASLYYLIHSTLIGAALFLLADVIAEARGSYADRLRAAPVMRSAILLGSVFLFAAVAITGMPPLSGFFGKVLLLNAAITHNLAIWIYIVILTSSLLLVIATARSGSILFYQVQDEGDHDGQNVNKVAFSAMAVLLLMSPALVILADPVTQLTEAIAAQLTDSSSYIDAVLSQAVSKGGH